MTASIAKAHRPIPSAPRDYHFPRFERRALENGVSLVVAPVKKLPLVTVTILIDAGSVCDPAGREGTKHNSWRNCFSKAQRNTTVQTSPSVSKSLGASIDAEADWVMPLPSP